ncbi:MAG: hypothetical protein IT303_03435 [Dehalococcoidia bacterium]|nr:hypothetical protein [Dehalococcoidia bacterium]
MRMPAFPRPALLPWILAAISAGLLVVGLVQGDTALVAMSVAGVLVGLFSYPLAKLLLGPPPNLDEPPPGDDDATPGERGGPATS